MTICKLDNNDYCERHKKRHTGREKILSQMDNEKGERYRESWENPGLLKKATTFIRAGMNYVLSGRQKVRDLEYVTRLLICEDCEESDKSEDIWKCKKCGCRLQETELLPGKARWASEECPLGKWPLIHVEKKGGCNCRSDSTRIKQDSIEDKGQSPTEG
jgi:ribosomal protein L37AE/L43A